ncbi:MAG: hypothetical protein IPP48_11440 [Chitinophagaceae bacterium]|nr:hypothetical protein [Chitinophagaceae bacterium]
MKIAINIWILRNKNLDGIGYFTIHTLKELIHQHPHVEFLLLCDKGFAENYFDFQMWRYRKAIYCLKNTE